jgi:hypothetical protein
MSLTHSADDRRDVEAQLGRPARAPWAVARRCHLDVPMVIESHPRLPDGSPFPTLYWLTCPVLVRRVGGLESKRAMSVLTDRLGRDAGTRERLDRAQRSYLAERDALEVVAEARSMPGGGAERIKCLHAHTAHELASGPNPVGAWALAQAGWPDCITPCVGDVDEVESEGVRGSRRARAPVPRDQEGVRGSRRARAPVPRDQP